MKIMYEIFAIQNCFNNINSRLEGNEEAHENSIERLRRGKLDVNDMFMPVRGRRTKPASDIVAEKKAPLDLFKSDLFMPNRGRRDFHNNALVTPLGLANKRNDIDLSTNDYFMPNRGRRQTSFDAILSENFFPQRGKRTTSVDPVYVDVPWFVPIRRNDDRILIDLLRDLNQLVNEVSKVRE